MKTPWNNGKIEKGTKLSQTDGGSTFNYGLLNGEPIDNNWKKYTNILTGEGSEVGNFSQFKSGTRYVKLLWLMNYNSSANTTIDIKDIIFSEIN